MRHLRNAHRGAGLPDQDGLASGRVIDDPADARALFSRCPVAAATPLLWSWRLSAGGTGRRDGRRATPVPAIRDVVLTTGTTARTGAGARSGPIGS